MRSLTWQGNPKPHPVWIETGDAERAAVSLARQVRRLGESGRTFVIAERRVRKLWEEGFFDALCRKLPDARLISAQGGESGKTLEGLGKIFEKLITHGADRYDIVIAVGGGALTDIVGFAASVYMRGIRWIGVPTTLVGQLDAGMGGKTGTDLPGAKNIMGSFWNPLGVLIAPAFLQTLSMREIRNGLSEALKTGECLDSGILSLLEKKAEGLLDKNPDALVGLIRACARKKMEVVARDPEDKSGQRAVLNLGHTVGHAIEAVGGFRRWSHGEAVAMGLLVINSLSVECGVLSAAENERIRSLVERLGLVGRKTPEPEAILPSLAVDKKKKGNQLMIVMPGPLGHARIAPIGAERLLDRKHWSWR